MSVKVLRPGLLTTVQDGGRYGLQHLGIVPCGAMDITAHTLANALVGNERNEATLEITVLGPELEFERAALVALCGAEFDARADGRALPPNRPVLLEAGTRLATRRALRGARAYLAVAGGLALAEVLGSRSTYVPARFGGLDGRDAARRAAHGTLVGAVAHAAGPRADRRACHGGPSLCEVPGHLAARAVRRRVARLAGFQPHGLPARGPYADARRGR
jgi:hypothetical protein